MKKITRKNDFKALTTLSLLSLIYQINSSEDLSEEKDLKIIFMTSFGTISASKIVPLVEDSDDNLDEENHLARMVKKTLINRNVHLIENGNVSIIEKNTSFVLHDVVIKTFNNDEMILDTFVLFSDSIQGISLGKI